MMTTAPSTTSSARSRATEPTIVAVGQRPLSRDRGIEQAAHVRIALYAFTVVPRAPNFCALRLVSSNLERA
jgi:hypothetical protein